jgi:hypothetical protein
MQRGRFGRCSAPAWPTSTAPSRGPSDIIGEWWTPLIIRDAFYAAGPASRTSSAASEWPGTCWPPGSSGSSRPGSWPGRATRNGRHATSTCLPKRGVTLFPVIAALLAWGDKGPPVRLAHRSCSIHDACGQPATLQATCDHWRRAAVARDDPARARARRLAGDRARHRKSIRTRAARWSKETGSSACRRGGAASRPRWGPCRRESAAPVRPSRGGRVAASSVGHPALSRPREGATVPPLDRRIAKPGSDRRSDRCRTSGGPWNRISYGCAGR